MITWYGEAPSNGHAANFLSNQQNFINYVNQNLLIMEESKKCLVWEIFGGYTWSIISLNHTINGYFSQNHLMWTIFI